MNLLVVVLALFVLLPIRVRHHRLLEPAAAHQLPLNQL
jgi:hypothetical protein